LFSARSIRQFLAAATIAGLILSLPSSVYASYLDDLLNQKRQKDQEIQDTENQIKEKEVQIQTYKNEVEAKDAAIAAIEKKLAETESQIQEAQKEIERLAGEIKKNREDYEVRKNALFESIRQLYESGPKTTLEVIVSAQDLTTLQRVASYHQDMQTQVNFRMKELDALKKVLDQKQSDQESKKQELEKLKEQQEAEKKDLAIQRADKAALLEISKGDKAVLEEIKKRQQEEEAGIDSIISDYYRRNSNYGSTYNGPVNTGFFGSPLPYDPPQLSVNCGDYMSPCYGWGAHYGVDLSAGQGTPVYASAGGVVVVAWNSGSTALSWIAIDHGNGYQTRYLHMSEIWVSEGQAVSKGQIIGLSGGSPGTIGAGWSTGAHLHFEIRINQGGGWYAVNPHDYLIIQPSPYW